mmetsp:Transcript_10412/g.32957  ORF Transcript_10412/g.32957 Transcript_10412/m.32957 type:complete len:333 (+) Transcript_10412:485-1483(+)
MALRCRRLLGTVDHFLLCQRVSLRLIVSGARRQQTQPQVTVLPRQRLPSHLPRTTRPPSFVRSSRWSGLARGRSTSRRVNRPCPPSTAWCSRSCVLHPLANRTCTRRCSSSSTLSTLLPGCPTHRPSRASTSCARACWQQTLCAARVAPPRGRPSPSSCSASTRPRPACPAASPATLRQNSCPATMPFSATRARGPSTLSATCASTASPAPSWCTSNASPSTPTGPRPRCGRVRRRRTTGVSLTTQACTSTAWLPSSCTPVAPSTRATMSPMPPSTASTGSASTTRRQRLCPRPPFETPVALHLVVQTLPPRNAPRPLPRPRSPPPCTTGQS